MELTVNCFEWEFPEGTNVKDVERSMKRHNFAGLGFSCNKPVTKDIEHLVGSLRFVIPREAINEGGER